MDSQAKGLKRKSSPLQTPPTKRSRVSSPDLHNKSLEELQVKSNKRKVEDLGEGPSTTMKRSLDQDDKEAVDTNRESNRSTSQQSTAFAMDGQAKRVKRKSSPHLIPLTPPTERTRIFSPDLHTKSLEELLAKYNKRKAEDLGEGPSTKKRSLDQDDKEAVDTNRESNRSMSLQSTAFAMDGQAKRVKRKSSPHLIPLTPPTKRRRVYSSDSSDKSLEELQVKPRKRKVEDLGEGPSTTKKRRLDQDDKEAVDTNRRSLRTRKRKAEADGEGLSEQRIRTLLKAKRKVPAKVQIAEFEAKYEEQDVIGYGGFGCVYAGYRKADNLPVAIKVIVTKWQGLIADRRKLLHEVAVMLRLTAETNGSMGAAAPVSLLDWYDLPRHLIMVMERPVPCVDLDTYMMAKGGILQEEEAKIIMKQMVDAAKYLEDKCIFHRDIKGGNILIETGSDVPRLRVIDFGLSRFAKKRSIFRVTCGTPCYIAPECFNRKYRAGPATVWQLGAVLFELVHGEGFYTEDFVDNYLTIDNELPENCRDFMQRCLTISPELRPTLEELKRHPWLG